MRLFIAIDIPEEIRDRMSRFIDGVRELAPDANWVRPESFHVTLKFLGETPPERLDELKRELTGVAGKPSTIRFGGLGFFPTPRLARVFWAGMQADLRLGELAGAVDEAAARLGFERERYRYTPHLTLARAGARSSGSPSGKGSSLAPRFRRLEEKLSALGYLGAEESKPDFGTMTAREFCLFESRLSPHGARYTKLAVFPLE